MFAGRPNVPILAVSQALMLSAIVLAVTLGAILGNLLAPSSNGMWSACLRLLSSRGP